MERYEAAARRGGHADDDEVAAYVDGLAKLTICPHCDRHDTCPKDGMPKVMPENVEALRDYGLVRSFNIMPRAGGLDDQPARTLVLFNVIAAQLSKHEMQQAAKGPRP